MIINYYNNNVKVSVETNTENTYWYTTITL